MFLEVSSHGRNNEDVLASNNQTIGNHSAINLSHNLTRKEETDPASPIVPSEEGKHYLDIAIRVDTCRYSLTSNAVHPFGVEEETDSTDPMVFSNVRTNYEMNIIN